MAKAVKLSDLLSYTGVLPYASELFGIYQPMIGWKSKRGARRFENGLKAEQAGIAGKFSKNFAAKAEIRLINENQLAVKLGTGVLDTKRGIEADSLLIEKLREGLPPRDQLGPRVWASLLTKERVEAILNDTVAPAYAKHFSDAARDRFGLGPATPAGPTPQPRPNNAELDQKREAALNAIEEQLRYESSLGGAILFLKERQNFNEIERLFFGGADRTEKGIQISKMLAGRDAVEAYLNIENMDPQDQDDLKRVVVSPMGVVHLFRQFFFELDSFLGSPVGHVWLAPGTTVELIEVQNRRTVTEMMRETSVETNSKSESELTQEAEISEAIKKDNEQSIQFGASVSASYAGITATTKFDLANSQKTSREEAHRGMRRQSEKLSTEIKRNLKTTFRTVTETTDTSTKRYLIQNTTPNLLNYELRRKMRQVAVQVQDVGSYLCWQTFVNRPGEELGLAKLLHISKGPELDALHAPEEIPPVTEFTESKLFTIPFISKSGSEADNEGEVYIKGKEQDDDEVGGNLELIEWRFPVRCVCPKPDFELANVEFEAGGAPIKVSIEQPIKKTGDGAEFILNLDMVDFQGQKAIQLGMTLHWVPTAEANQKIAAQNKSNLDKYKAREQEETRKAYVRSARERVKLSHGISPRPSSELREEERIVVYRKLIQELLTQGIEIRDERTQHVVSELLNSIFDVDKMLYFVAPEWWRPRMRPYQQDLNLEEGTDGNRPTRQVSQTATKWSQLLTNRSRKLRPVDSTSKTLKGSTVGWGGIGEAGRPNYYITEDSEPARFGSSLGWLLQLDGDDRRNAFLNAPWVKVVLPVRPGKEKAAINWLQGVEGMNGISENDIYRTNNPSETDSQGRPLNGQKMLDVLFDLARKINKKHQEGVETGKYPKASDLANPTLVDQANVVTSTPIDRVYEHGFYTLEDGFRANVNGNYEIFDQWLEILPTEQIVPVEVKYDPVTGRQV